MRTSNIALVVVVLLVGTDAKKETKAEKPAETKKETQADSGVCHSDKKVQTLETELADAKMEATRLKEQLMKASAAPSVEPFSVTESFSQMGAILGDVIEHQLAQTEMDDQVVAALTKNFGTVSTFTQNVIEQVKAMDYRKHVESLGVGEKYNTLVAPHVASVTTMAQPYVNQYVQPALDSVSPHLAIAQDAASAQYKAFETGILPKIHTAGQQAYGYVAEAKDGRKKGEALLGKAMDPVYTFAAKVLPAKYSKALPTSPVDRFLMLVVVIFLSYVSLRVFLIVARIVLKTTRFGGSMGYKTAKVGVFLPLGIAFRLLGLAFWFGTCFYCCGLCRRRKAVTSGKGKKGNDNKAAAKKVSVDEVVALLKEAKKQNKLDAAVRQACNLCKSGKGFQAPKNLEGKQITKDILKPALDKMGVDATKCGL